VDLEIKTETSHRNVEKKKREKIPISVNVAGHKNAQMESFFK
jgi:hypothetical protein